MGKGRAPTTIEYELIHKHERQRAYRVAVKRNKAMNIAKKRARNS